MCRECGGRRKVREIIVPSSLQRNDGSETLKDLLELLSILLGQVLFEDLW